MKAIPRTRRFACALTALGVAALLLHAQLADALVTRGDDAFRAGDHEGAINAYERARLLDPWSSVAADRLAFQLALRHDVVAARRAVRIATAGLGGGPSVPLYADRAFAELELRDLVDAERDFGAAGLLGRDPRYDHLAARTALQRGDRRAAIRFARHATSLDPKFQPARALLRRIE